MHISCNKAKCPHLINECAPNMLPKKLNSYIQICNPTKSEPFMSKIDRINGSWRTHHLGNKSDCHNTFDIYLIDNFLIPIMKSHTKMSSKWTNLIE